jgi:beta-RFAP synthase
VDHRGSSNSVTIRVPARLHLGFLDLNGELGRRFGSIGVAISGYATTLTIASASRLLCEGIQAERGRNFLLAMTAHLKIPSTLRLHIDEAIPSHAGLGSGTQMALAIAAALRRLHGLKLDIAGDSLCLDRGARSGIGIGLFNRGGLIVDSGRGHTSAVPPVISRLPFPPKWRFLLVADPNRQGVHGASEQAAFAALPPFPAVTAGSLCRLTLMKILPGLVEHDVSCFGAGISEMQAILGDYFAAVQGGGRFASPHVAGALQILARAGAHGVGQSSWGPTGFALAATTAQAQQLAALVRNHARGSGLDIRICAGLNHGAQMTTAVAASKPISVAGGLHK